VLPYLRLAPLLRGIIWQCVAAWVPLFKRLDQIDFAHHLCIHGRSGRQAKEQKW